MAHFPKVLFFCHRGRFWRMAPRSKPPTSVAKERSASSAAPDSGVSFNRCIVQLEGHTVRCPIELLQYEFRNSEHVRDLFVSYSETLLSQVQQTVACNSMHTIEERMCRWLLMMHDRAGGEVLPYTHEFLSRILGANRKRVTLAAQSMQTAGLITDRWGTMQVLDRAGLEKAWCECYAIVNERFDAFLTPPSTAVQGDNKGRRMSRPTEEVLTKPRLCRVGARTAAGDKKQGTMAGQAANFELLKKVCETDPA